MKLHKPGAEIFVPDNIPIEEALARTTHLGISAHQDDIEIMAVHGVIECFGKSDKWFCGAVVTNGAGSPRDDVYADYTDEQMQNIRKLEQKKAAFVGEYAAQVLFDFGSSEVKDSSSDVVVNDILALLSATKPEVVYTHNLADKHDTHVSVVLRLISAIRKMPASDRPKKIYGSEVWRGLDWLCDSDKSVLDVSAHENISMAVLGVHDSQICGGKRYDLATQGRRRANATYFASHGTDQAELLTYTMDLTPLVEDDNLDPKDYVLGLIHNFVDEVSERVGKFK